MTRMREAARAHDWSTGIYYANQALAIRTTRQTRDWVRRAEIYQSWDAAAEAVRNGQDETAARYYEAAIAAYERERRRGNAPSRETCRGNCNDRFTWMLGDVHYLRGDWAGALEIYRRAQRGDQVFVTSDRTRTIAWIEQELQRLALVQAQRERARVEAEAAARTAARNNRRAGEMSNTAARQIRRGNWDQAENLLQQAAELAPGNSDIQADLARVRAQRALSRGDIAAAREQYQRVLAFEPGATDAAGQLTSLQTRGASVLPSGGAAMPPSSGGGVGENSIAMQQLRGIAQNPGGAAGGGTSQGFDTAGGLASGETGVVAVGSAPNYTDAQIRNIADRSPRVRDAQAAVERERQAAQRARARHLELQAQAASSNDPQERQRIQISIASNSQELTRAQSAQRSAEAARDEAIQVFIQQGEAIIEGEETTEPASDGAGTRR